MQEGSFEANGKRYNVTNYSRHRAKLYDDEKGPYDVVRLQEYKYIIAESN